jgi:hypothetical protein
MAFSTSNGEEIVEIEVSHTCAMSYTVQLDAYL